MCLAPANVHELSAVPDLTDGTRGIVIGDRNYWSPLLTEELAQRDLALLAPYRWAKRDPAPRRSFAPRIVRVNLEPRFGLVRVPT